MPTNTNVYNSRVTDEALEKKFRDTFRAQGGAELVDDLYASGVIVPVVDFTSAAEGSALRQDLQSAWDFATGHVLQDGAGTTTVTSNTGFWRISLNTAVITDGTAVTTALQITDGTTTKDIWVFRTPAAVSAAVAVEADDFLVFIRAGDTLQVTSTSGNGRIAVEYRQIADVSGNLTNPLGFTSS